MKKVLIITACFLFSAGELFSQSSGTNIVLYSVTEANGLSDDHVQCVFKDRQGFIWIGTSDGLNMMDGSSITIFRHRENDSSSLLNNNILCLSQDKAGNIWIGTSKGLSCYFKEKNNFLSFKPPTSSYGNAGFINSFYITSKQDIWCSTDGGLLFFDAANRSFQPFYNPDARKNNNAPCNKLTHLIKDNHENKLWLSSADGVWSFDLNTHQYKKMISAENDTLYKPLFAYIYESSDNKIWAGNWGNGLEELETITGKVIHYNYLPGNPNIVTCINELSAIDGKKILLLDGYLEAFDPSAKLFFQYPKPPQLAEIPYIFPVYKSDDDWVWMASSAGLFIYNPQRQLFRHHFFQKNITSQSVVLSEWNGLLAVGGEGKNFLKWYDSGWNIKKDLSYILNSFHGKQTTSSPVSLLSLSIENNSISWMATSQGVIKVNSGTGKTEWFHHHDDDSSSLPRNFITHLFFDSQKQLWIFPWRGGIWIMDTLTGKCKKLWDGFIKVNGNTKNLVIANATEDDNGNIWMNDLDEGIVLYERNTGKFSKPFAKEIGERYNTASIYLRNGFLYSATSYFLLKWNENNHQLSMIHAPQDMSKEIYDLCPDKNGNWWIATKNGLIVYNEVNKTFERFTTADGLVNNDMNGTLFCRSNGNMLFGNLSYITGFNPQKFLQAAATSHSVLIRGILANEQPVNWNNLSGLHFNYHTNNIMIRWALPDFSNPFHNQYYCKLQGIDSGWRYVGNRGEVQYANLSPGKYTVQLRAVSANGVASSNIIPISFEISAPFWKTAGFISLVCLILISVFGFAVGYISQRNLKEKLLQLEKEQAVEKERNRISRDMHDDLGSGLTKIAILSEVVKKQMNEPEKAKQQLENISQSSRELVDNLQDIIWVLNPRNDTLESLASYIREYALKFFEPFKIETHFIYPEKFPLIRLSEETRRNIFLTVKESLNNIGKHAWCDNSTLSIRITDNSIEMMIKDDGQGFDKTTIREFGNGLINMKNRMEQIGGIYEILSEPGKGTETRIKVPV